MNQQMNRPKNKRVIELAEESGLIFGGAQHQFTKNRLYRFAELIVKEMQDDPEPQEEAQALRVA